MAAGGGAALWRLGHQPAVRAGPGPVLRRPNELLAHLVMSLLILAVGWAYTQICRIYPDGGGVYTAAKQQQPHAGRRRAHCCCSRTTRSRPASACSTRFTTSACRSHHAEQIDQTNGRRSAATLRPAVQPMPATSSIRTARSRIRSRRSCSPGIRRGSGRSSRSLVIGLFNLMGPKHTGGFALAAAVGMIFITLLITLPRCRKFPGHDMPQRIGHLNHQPGEMWVAFVSIVLALSGVEAIANLTGVMKKPVAKTANKAIWVVAAEVAIFNVLLAMCMLAIFPLDRDAHVDDMLAFLTGITSGRGRNGPCASSAGCCCCRRPTPPSPT